MSIHKYKYKYKYKRVLFLLLLLLSWNCFVYCACGTEKRAPYHRITHPPMCCVCECVRVFSCIDYCLLTWQCTNKIFLHMHTEKDRQTHTSILPRKITNIVHAHTTHGNTQQRLHTQCTRLHTPTHNKHMIHTYTQTAHTYLSITFSDKFLLLFVLSSLLLFFYCCR